MEFNSNSRNLNTLSPCERRNKTLFISPTMKLGPIPRLAEHQTQNSSSNITASLMARIGIRSPSNGRNIPKLKSANQERLISTPRPIRA